MKSTIRQSTIIVFLFSISMTVKGQTAPVKFSEGIIYSLGLESGWSAGKFKEQYSRTLGGSFQIDIPIAADIYIDGNAGYTNLNGKGGRGDIQMLPLTAGFKIFPFSLLYIQGNAGAGILLNKADVGYQKSTAFIYTPQIGFQFPVGGSNGLIDFGIRYHGSTKYTNNIAASRINYFAFRLAYAIASK
jgi:hypothetical protein